MATRKGIPINTNDFPRDSRPKYFPIIILIVVLLAVLAFNFGISSAGKQSPLVCGDGTFYNSCSLVKPYFCSQGSLVERASVCGCSAGLNKQGEKCTFIYQTGEKNVDFDYILDGTQNQISMPVYLGMEKYLNNVSRSNFYSGSEKPSRADFALKSMNEPKQESLLLPLVEKIQNITTNRDDQVRIAISLVQNIPYGFSNKTISLGRDESVNYSRYPYEVLYEDMGVCSEKSVLLAFILEKLGYGTALIYYGPENHEALGVKCPVEYSLDGSGYCFIETVGPSIITDNKLSYTGGATLQSTPQIIPLSQGASIGNWQEFQDAKKLESLMKGGIPFLRQWELGKLEKKYGLEGEYNLG